LKQSEKKLSNLLVRRVAVFFSDRTRVIAERQFSLSVGRWRARKSFFSLSMPRAFQKLPFFCLFYPLHKAFAFFFVVQVKQKEKNFNFVMKLKDQTIKADKQLKKLFLFFIRFKSNKRERFFCIVDAFFWQMEMFCFLKTRTDKLVSSFVKV